MLCGKRFGLGVMGFPISRHLLDRRITYVMNG